MKNSDKTNTFNVNIQPIGRRAVVKPEQTLLDAAQATGVEIISICGGIGVCGSCKIRLVEGKLSSPTSSEEEFLSTDEINGGFRLACQAYPLSDVIIDVPPESLTTPQRLQIESREFHIEPDPSVKIFPLHIEPPTLEDLRADSERLFSALTDKYELSNLEFEYSVLPDISDKLRNYNWKVNVIIRHNQIIQITPFGENNQNHYPLLGLAVDVGTTKVAGYLVDLLSGETLTNAGAMNPQIKFGEDVISRISYANRPIEFPDQIPRRSLLQKSIISKLNELIASMCKDLHNEYPDLSGDQIVECVVVGNTAMHHLLAGYPVRQLGESPYVPAVKEETKILARDIGLDIAPGSYVYLPPNIAGYVGADHVSMLLATLFDSRNEYFEGNKNIIAIDIGTNTELSLLHNGSMVCCSCASGPAFEGAHIRDGMRAAPGAIERVKIDDETIRYKTIADQKPVGICGSGILDAVAQMYHAGIIDQRGSIVPGRRVVNNDNNNPAFLLVDSRDTGHGKDILISRKDVSEIQLAKGAIRSGIDILLQESKIKPHQIDLFIIAGAFGTYIDVGSAIMIGMFPNLPEEIFVQVGNAAGAGARQMLISQERRLLTKHIIKKLRYVELSNYSGFSEIFAKSLFFPRLTLP